MEHLVGFEDPRTTITTTATTTTVMNAIDGDNINNPVTVGLEVPHIEMPRCRPE